MHPSDGIVQYGLCNIAAQWTENGPLNGQAGRCAKHRGHRVPRKEWPTQILQVNVAIGLQQCRYPIDNCKSKRRINLLVSRSTHRSHLLSPSVRFWNVFWFMKNDKTDFSSNCTITSRCSGVFWISGNFMSDSSLRSTVNSSVDCV